MKNLTTNEIKKLFQDMAITANVAIPTVRFSHEECKENQKNFMFSYVVAGEFNPRSHIITIFPEGYNADTCKHEFIHYLRWTMRLNTDLKTLRSKGIRDGLLKSMYEFEENRTESLTKKPWPEILDSLKKELTIKQATLGDLY